MADTDKGMWLEPDVTGYAPLDYHRTRGRLTPLQKSIWIISYCQFIRGF